jgi:AbiU2
MTAPPNEDAALIEEWRGWLDILTGELQEAILDQTLWTEVRDAIQERYPEANLWFLLSYSRVYVHSQVMLIRRICDTGKGTRSLWRLIHALERKRNVFTADWFIKLWRERNGQPGDEWNDTDLRVHFERVHATTDDPTHLSRARLLEHKARLEGNKTATEQLAEVTDREIAKVKEWANTRVAHASPVARDELRLTFAELRKALDDLGEILNYYNILLRGSDWDLVVGMTDAWKGPLRASLFPETPDTWWYRRFAYWSWVSWP